MTACVYWSIAVRYSVVHCVAVCCHVLHCVAVCCSALHCVAGCCSAWQYGVLLGIYRCVLHLALCVGARAGG